MAGGSVMDDNTATVIIMVAFLAFGAFVMWVSFRD